ncbi:MAG: anti-sigma factor [Chloroflexota bacterium]
MAMAVPSVVPPPALRARILAAVDGRPRAIISRRRWGGWAVAAAVAFAVGVDDAQQRRGRAAALSDLAVADGQLALQQEIAQPILNGQPYVHLAPVSGHGPSAIWINPAGKAPYLAAPNLPALKPDRTYQLWFLRGSTPEPGGTFQSGAVLTLPALPVGTTALAITVEPGGGSAKPTSVPIWLVQCDIAIHRNR